MSMGIIGLKRGTVRVVPYNPDWPIHFQAERDLLRDALGSKVLEIRHIGSTAIPGMPAKPIIDILAAVRNLADVNDLLHWLGSAMKIKTTAGLLGVDTS